MAAPIGSGVVVNRASWNGIQSDPNMETYIGALKPGTVVTITSSQSCNFAGNSETIYQIVFPMGSLYADSTYQTTVSATSGWCLKGVIAQLIGLELKASANLMSNTLNNGVSCATAKSTYTLTVRANFDTTITSPAIYLRGKLYDGDSLVKTQDSGSTTGTFGSVSFYSLPNTTKTYRVVVEVVSSDDYGASSSEISVTIEHVHSVPEIVNAVAATCLNAGYSGDGKCTLCGAAMSTGKAIPALGHSSISVPVVAATCEQTGLTAGTKCSRCGVVLTAQQEIPALGHDWPDYNIIEPTCTEAGLKSRTCIRCGQVDSQTLSALGHNLVMIDSTDLSCTQDGTATYKCAREGCDCEVVDVIAQATGHKAASEPSGYVAPTHTTPGYSGDICCERCGEVMTAGMQIEATGHQFGPWIYSSGGEHVRICADGEHCGIEREPCSYDEFTVTTEPGCTSSGLKTRHCTICGGSNTKMLGPLGHDIRKEVTRRATRTTPGILTCKCSRCTHTEEQVFLKLKHRKPESKS